MKQWIPTSIERQKFNEEPLPRVTGRCHRNNIIVPDGSAMKRPVESVFSSQAAVFPFYFRAQRRKTASAFLPRNVKSRARVPSRVLSGFTGEFWSHFHQWNPRHQDSCANTRKSASM